MNARSKITSKGQTTIPLEVREALGLKPGDSLSYEINGDEVRLVKPKRAIDFAGILHVPNRQPITVEEMNEAIGEAIIERYERSFDRR